MKTKICKICKKEFTPKLSIQKYCCARCNARATVEKARERAKLKKAGKPVNYKSLRAKARRIFSRWIRNRDKGVCFTCGIVKDPKEMQCGHFIHRNCLDFDEIGNNCQCIRCNNYLSGNLGEYAVRLISKYGMKEVEELRARGNIARRFTIDELEEIIERYGN